MKILIADKFSEKGIQSLKKLGVEVFCDPNLDGETLTKALAEKKPEVLIVRSTKVKKEMLKAADSLSLVIRAGAGVNTIDVDTASKLGIFVTNCPGKNSVAVAELTLGLILALDRRIADNVRSLREGKWDKKEFSKADGLKGKTIGLIGVGNIGQEVIQRIRAFELAIVAWSRSLSDERAEKLGITRLHSPMEVAQKADIVSIHLALTPETQGLCNKKFFAAMKEGAYFINTSRAEVVDEAALIEAMNTRKIRAGLDVFADEPSSGTCDWQTKLTKHEAVVGTHHIGASTEEAQNAIAEETLRIVKTYVQEGVVLNCVNLDPNPKAQGVLTVRHLNRVGVLAKILKAIQEENINVLEMENSLFAGDEAAIAKISLHKIPSQKLLSQMTDNNSDIISLSVIKASQTNDSNEKE